MTKHMLVLIAVPRRKPCSRTQAVQSVDFLKILKDCGKDALARINATLGLANVAVGLQDWDESKKLFREAIATQKTLFDSGHPFVLAAKGNLAEVLILLGEFEEAREIVSGLLEKTPSSDPRLAQREQLMDTIRKAESEKKSQ